MKMGRSKRSKAESSIKIFGEFNVNYLCHI
jgi:hypothetical protein